MIKYEYGDSVSFLNFDINRFLSSFGSILINDMNKYRLDRVNEDIGVVKDDLDRVIFANNIYEYKIGGDVFSYSGSRYELSFKGDMVLGSLLIGLRVNGGDLFFYDSGSNNFKDVDNGFFRDVVVNKNVVDINFLVEGIEMVYFKYLYYLEYNLLDSGNSLNYILNEDIEKYEKYMKKI